MDDDTIPLDQKLFQHCIHCVQYVLHQVNPLYKIMIYDDDGFEQQVDEMLQKNQDCAFASGWITNKSALVLMENNRLASYMMFTTEVNRLGETFLAMQVSCTDKAYRSKRLSTFLRMILFLYAIFADLDFLVSNANTSSYALLKKYGFEGTIGQYLVSKPSYTFYTVSASTKNPLLLKQVLKFLF